MPLKPLFRLFTLGAFTLFASCATTTTAQSAKESSKPKNIILMIADGTGLSQISASQYFSSQPSNYDRFKHIGLIKTSSSSDLVTDSAAGATAFSAGVKTYNGAIGVDKDTIPVPTILEQLEIKGYDTGIIATSTITHATPGSFYAHVKTRKMEEEIANNLVSSNIDFFAGGGVNFFTNRVDKRDVVMELRKKGYVIDTTRLNKTAKLDKNKRYGYLLSEGGMPSILDGRGSFLYDATKMGINRLSMNKKGFFLMVEGSQVDWGGHNNDADYLISELIDFDTVIGQVLDFAGKDGNTLVIVTADHETGGFTLAADDGDYNKIKPTFSTGGHSATMVPVFAYGPGASEFSGVYENTEIYHKMRMLLNL
ncbi:alkaline phosphatase [Dokdonia sinensis]|uniref:Alkaline phosphatase n=1 Tax=Dokdonia sinensis TaxID=2479847 RepID=A0A3M0FYY6_9FLAO|nr:alkaline phosphatase [Dokdonia sinensis]RMB57097.1 alkaline phosphatase [Dokdonia sinensis]